MICPSILSCEERTGPSKVPVGELTLTLAMVVRRSSIDSPRAVSARVFTLTRSARRLPPVSVTSPTPLTWLSFCASRVSTKSSTSVSCIVLEVMPRVRIGLSAGLTLA